MTLTSRELTWWVRTLSLTGPNRATGLLMTAEQERAIRDDFPEATNPLCPELLYGLPVYHRTGPMESGWYPAVIEQRHTDWIAAHLVGITDMGMAYRLASHALNYLHDTALPF